MVSPLKANSAMYALSTKINEACLQIDAICKIELQQRSFSAKFERVAHNYKIKSQPVFVGRLNQIIFVKDQLKELVMTDDVKEIYLILEDHSVNKSGIPPQVFFQHNKKLCC